MPKYSTKRDVRTAYFNACIGLTDAIAALMFDFGMTRGDAFKYLGF